MGHMVNKSRAMRRVAEAHHTYTQALRHAVEHDHLTWSEVETITVGDRADIIADIVTSGLTLHAQAELLQRSFDELPFDLDNEYEASIGEPALDNRISQFSSFTDD